MYAVSNTPRCRGSLFATHVRTPRMGQKGTGHIVLLGGTVGAPLLLAILLLLLIFFVWVADINTALGLALLPVVIGGMTWALFFSIRKTGERSVEIEAARWLAERDAGVTPRERKLRNLGISWSLCIPALTVLAVVLFLPEKIGRASCRERV